MAEFEKNSESKTTREIKREIRIGGIHTETGCDYFLPDYMGDVKRVLNSAATVIPTGTYCSDGEISVCGEVEYSVLYVDALGRLTEAKFTSEYRMATAHADGVECARAQEEIQNLAVRISGPRKISVKATVTATVSAIRPWELKGATLPEGSRARTIRANMHSSAYFSLTDREYADEGAILEGVRCESVNVVCCGARVAPSSAAPCEGGISVEGAIVLYAIVEVSEESLVRVEREIPFSEQLLPMESDGAEIAESSCASAWGYVTGVNVTVNNVGTDDGNSGCSVVFNVIADFLGTLEGNEELELVSDAYCVGAECENSYRSVKLSELCHVGTVHHALDFEFDRAEISDKNICEILHAPTSFKVLQLTPSEGGVNIEVAVGITIIGRGAQGDDVFSVKLTRPVTIFEKISENVGADAKITARIFPCRESFSMDGGKVYIRAEVAVFLSAVAEREMRYLSDMEVKASIAEDECKICVYYPVEGDTLWSVAKRYKIPMEKLAEDNGLVVKTSVGDADEYDSPISSAVVINIF